MVCYADVVYTVITVYPLTKTMFTCKKLLYIAYHLDKVIKRERNPPFTITHQMTYVSTKTYNTTQHNMGAGSWVPSLEDWGGELKSLLHVEAMYSHSMNIPVINHVHSNTSLSLSYCVYNLPSNISRHCNVLDDIITQFSWFSYHLPSYIHDYL